jgi:rod shape-determining protein MreC
VLKTFLRSKIWLFTVLAVAIILTFVFIPSFPAALKHFSTRALMIPVKAGSGLARYFRSKNDLMQDKETLQAKLTKLSLEYAQLEGLKQENERLRDLLKFKKKFGFGTIPAEIIARNPNDWIDSVLINKGRDDGIRKDSAVCSAEGLLGRVAEVDKNTSYVMLITHPNFKTGGVVSEGQVNSVVTGGGKGMVRMLYIPLDADVKEGSDVLTSGFNRIFPEGIGIGKIVSVEKSKTGLYKYAIIKPFADPFYQREVLCIK